MSAAQTAFVRSWAEGLDLLAAWRRYLAPDGSGDARQARAALQDLLERLRDLARAQGRPDLAVLLRRDPEAIADRAPSTPSLADFAATQAADFYSESELQALYAEVHGRTEARSSARRRERLRERLVAAVQALDHPVAAQPRPADSPQRWFDAGLAARLMDAGLDSLAALQSWIGQRGLHWHRRLPRIGPVTAARITAWLHAHRASLGALPDEARWTRQGPRSGAALARPSHGPAAAVAARPPGTTAQWIRDPLSAEPPVPAQRSASDPLSDGAIHGPVPRAAEGEAAWADEGLVTAARGHPDAGPIGQWLMEHRPGSHTWRAYRREAERWLLWAQAQGDVPLRALGADDGVRYLAFLSAPPAAWTAPRGTPRWSAHWRPLEGRLGARSLQATQDILRALCAWMQRQGLRDDNPWATLRQASSERTGGDEESADPAVPDKTTSAARGDRSAAMAIVAAADHAAENGTAPDHPFDGPGAFTDTLVTDRPRPLAGCTADGACAESPGASTAARVTLLTDWAWVQSWIDQLADTPRLQRLGGVLRSVVDTGLSLPRLAMASGSARAIAGAPSPHAAQRRPEAPPPDLRPALTADAAAAPRSAAAVLRQPQADGLMADARPRSTPCIRRLDGARGLSPARLRELVRTAFRVCALWVRSRDETAAARLAAADARWLRRVHLHLSLAQGLPRARIQFALNWRHWPRGQRRHSWALT